MKFNLTNMRVAPLVCVAMVLGLGWGQQAVGLCQHGALTSVRLQASLTTHRFMHRYHAPSSSPHRFMHGYHAPSKKG